MRRCVVSYLVSLVYHPLYKLGTALYIIHSYIKCSGCSFCLKRIEYTGGTAVFITFIKCKIYRFIVGISDKQSAERTVFLLRIGCAYGAVIRVGFIPLTVAYLFVCRCIYYSRLRNHRTVFSALPSVCGTAA